MVKVKRTRNPVLCVGLLLIDISKDPSQRWQRWPSKSPIIKAGVILIVFFVFIFDKKLVCFLFLSSIKN